MSDLPTCFVISPIGQPNSDERKRADEVLDHIIRKALNNLYHVVRADEIAQPGMIAISVVQQLDQAPLVIADLTGRNPNVFYELAVRHAVRKPIIHITEDSLQELPFDINGMRVIQFDHRSLSSAAQCIDSIREYLAEFDAGAQVHSPISLALDILGQTNITSDQKAILTQIVDLSRNIAWLGDNISQIRESLERPQPGMQEMADAMLTMAEVFDNVGEEDPTAERLAEAYRSYGRGLRARSQ